MKLEELLEKGVNLYKNDEFEHAEKALKQAFELDPQNLDVLNFLGLCNIHSEQINKAVSYFNTALEIDPKDSIVWNNKGDALGMMESYDEAIACFKQAIEINPEYGNAHFNLGLVLAEEGDFESAHKSFDVALGLLEGDELLDAYYEKAFLFIEDDEFDKALEVINKAEDVKVTAEISNLKATCLDHLGKHAEALELYESIEERAEDDELLADILYNKAFSLIELNRKPEAVKALLTAMELLPEIKEDIEDNEILSELDGISEILAK